jgi:hypothetical protein
VEGKNPGPPAAGAVGADGAFTLKSDAGGAVVGKNNVTYSAPGGEASTDPTKEGTPSPYINLTPKDPVVEVKSGTNNFTIELKRSRGLSRDKQIEVELVHKPDA